jgi:sulfite reductase (NADPH) flavoprotein alpha-component
LTASRLVISRNNVADLLPIPIALPLDPNSTGESDLLGIFDQNLLKSHSILKYAKTGSIVLIVTSWTSEELLENVSQEFTSLALDRKLSIYIVNVKDLAKNIVGAEGPIQDAAQNLLLELVFLRLYLGPLATESTILQLVRTSPEDALGGITVNKFSSHAWSGLQLLHIPPLVVVASPNDPPTLKEFDFNAIAVETTEGKLVDNGARLSSWHDAAKHLLFPSIFTPSQGSDSLGNPALRPEIPDKTFLVTCTVNKRLTPLEYDRNVFHLEFDTSGTGLKYAIGEALGIHGWNDEQEVLDFCAWYGVDPQRLITIPVIADEPRTHTRTIMQALQQQIDLFGRPPKSFYTDLAEYATADVDRYALRFIGSPEGSSTFKKLSEKDTVTFADVLKTYKSARPGIERLCELIGDIKPRHYSIASAQSVVGDRVDLLVVTVEWFAPDGKYIMLVSHFRV